MRLQYRLHVARSMPDTDPPPARIQHNIDRHRGVSRSAIIIHGRIERGNLTVLDQLATLLTYVSIAVAIVVTTHVFFQVADRYPVYTFDDSLANMSVVLSKLGLYGLPAVPWQGGGVEYQLRIGSFLNYGPLPFYVGAAFDWLFGTSYEIQRFLYPLCLILSSVLAFFTFRNLNVGLAAIYIWLVLALFWSVMWPMVRPDPFTALFCVAAFASSTAAVVTQQRRYYFIGSFVVVCAATTHLIVIAILPWALIAFIAGVVLHRRDNPGSLYLGRFLQQRFVVSLVGAALAFAVYLNAIDFRIGDFLSLLLHVGENKGQATTANAYLSVVQRHLSITWESAPAGIRTLVFAGIGSGILSVLMLPAFGLRQQKTVIAHFGLPILFVVLYTLSIGFYGNFHTGYALIGQLTGVWAAVAGYGCFFWLIAEKLPILGPLAIVGTSVTALGLIFWQSSLTMSNGVSWAKEQHVSFPAYYDQVMTHVPKGSLALGNATFGLESGTRVAVSSWYYDNYRLKWLAEEERERVPPDYLILNDYLNTLAADYLTDGDTIRMPLPEMFGSTRYQQKLLVHGEPYGTTILYEKRKDAGGVITRPLVAAYDHVNDVWNGNLQEITTPVVEQADPVVFDLSLLKVKGRARLSKIVRLLEGTYLLEIAPDVPGSGMFIATTTPLFSSARGINRHIEYQEVPFAPYETSVHLLVRNPGNAIFLSELSHDKNRSPDFSVVRAWRIPGYDASVPVVLPPLLEWRKLSAEALTLQPGGSLLVIGDESPFHHQVRTPAISVRPDTTMRFSVDITELNGHVSVGILKENGKDWLRAPVRSEDLDFEFNTGANRQIYVVVANLQRDSRTTTRFIVSNAQMIARHTPLEQLYRFLNCPTSPSLPEQRADIRQLPPSSPQRYCHPLPSLEREGE